MDKAIELRKAMKGAGTDNAAIIRIMSSATGKERQAIALAFQASFGLDLLKELKSELSGHFEQLAMAAFQDRYAYWASQIKAAIKGFGTNEKLLIPLVIMQSDADTEALRPLYQQMYGVSMAKDISDDISASADWARLLRGWMAGQNTNVIDPQQGADQLFEAAKGAGTDEDVFIRILCTTKPECYRQIVAAFEEKHKKTVEKLIKEEFSGKSEWAFLMAHHYLISQAQGVAFVIHSSMKGCGTNERLLTNATVLFADMFKGEKMTTAYKLFGDLAKDLRGDLSGKAEKAFLAMWGLPEEEKKDKE